jgi:hypothetical protein
MRLIHLCALLLFAMPSAVYAASDKQDPVAATRAFYDTYLRTHVTGVPPSRQQKTFAPVISARLAGLIARAAAAEAQHYKLTKNQEPPLAEGDIFTSLFEGAQRYRVLTCKTAAERAECLVELSYRGPRAADEQNWKDQVLLVRENKRWVVDDIAYGGNWDFGNKGKLSESLETIAKWQP